MRTYRAHETERMRQLNGAPLAWFKTRSGAFVIDLVAAFVCFLLIIVPG
jgi:hypothetical protein